MVRLSKPTGVWGLGNHGCFIGQVSAPATKEFIALAEQGESRAQVALQVMSAFEEFAVNEGGPQSLDKLEKWRNAPNKQKYENAVN